MKNFNEKNLEKILDNCPIFVIFGPTGCGKTSFSISLAKKILAKKFFPFIISADSRQIYQNLDIGTGKITESEKENILHYGLDIIPPTEEFSVVEFEKHIDNCPFFVDWKNFHKKNIIPEIVKNNDFKGVIPIICGGTGLYIDSLIFERKYMWSKPNIRRREELEKFRQEFGNQKLWQKLYEIDPKYASELHPNNHTYIIRAIEIFEETGKSKLESIDYKPKLEYPTVFLTPYEDSLENRKSLYEKINSRISLMLKNGLVAEVENICKKFGSNAIALKTIGYKEIMQYKNGEISLAEAENLIAQHNRNYAKRQITWNKKYLEFIKTDNY